VPLPCLRLMNLNENRITTIPEGFFVLRSLEVLVLNCNFVRGIEGAALYTENLAEYYLHGSL